jgi:flagellar hook protein FlgE
MGLFDALNSAVSGLQGQSFAMQNISGNIANSQTIAYKGIDTSFSDLIPGNSTPSQQVAGGVMASAVPTNNVQGTIQTASSTTNMAINGDGYFVVQTPASFSSGAPVFSSIDNYTRRGDFQLDANGYLVNGAGYYLEGVPIDSTTGNPIGSVASPLQFQNNFLPASATTQVQYGVNLPTLPKPNNYDSSTANSELINPADFAGTNPLAPPTGGGVVEGQDVTTFVNESIDGGSVTVYDASGTQANLQLRWAKTDSVAAGGADTWELFYQTDSSATSGNSPAWENTGQSFVFNASGQLSPAITNIPLTGVTINGVSLGSINISAPTGSITEFANASGTATVNNMEQNGYAAGQLQTIAVGNAGVITGTFSNGQNVALAEVSLVHFNSPNNLKSLNGGAYAVTDTSGAALAGATGQIVGQSLENSNTDIATEFTKLIVTQQAYSANTKVITTASQMSQDLLNVIR